MGMWSTLAPIATIGAGAMLGPAGAMGVGALAGALSADERNKEMNAKAARSRNAAAGAIEASWARKDGRGSIPSIFDFNESESGNMMAGTLGGGMQGYSAAKGFEKDGGFDFFKAKPSGSFTPQASLLNQQAPANALSMPTGTFGSNNYLQAYQDPQQAVDFYSFGKKPLN